MKIQSSYYDVASQVVKTFGLTLNRVSGNFRGTTAPRWLQLHDAKALPANEAVPVRSYPITESAPFLWPSVPAELQFQNGLVVAVSETEDELTISTDTVDLFVDGQSFIDDTNWTVSGDYTSATDNVTFWNNASGPKTLMRLEVTDLTNPESYWVMLFAVDAPVDGARPIAQFFLPAGESLDLFFGGGLVPGTLTNVNTLADACTVVISTTANTLTAAADPQVALKASYK